MKNLLNLLMMTLISGQLLLSACAKSGGGGTGTPESPQVVTTQGSGSSQFGYATIPIGPYQVGPNQGDWCNCPKDFTPVITDPSGKYATCFGGVLANNQAFGQSQCQRLFQCNPNDINSCGVNRECRSQTGNTNAGYCMEKLLPGCRLNHDKQHKLLGIKWLEVRVTYIICDGKVTE